MNTHISVIDLIKQDHKILKECFTVLKDEKARKAKKHKVARLFLDHLKGHADTEQACVYNQLKNNKKFRLMILEGIEEHAIADREVQQLMSKVKRSQTLSDVDEARLKVLAELLEHHIYEEEKELLPKMEKELSEAILYKMGDRYIKLRNFSMEDLDDAWASSATYKDFKPRVMDYSKFLAQQLLSGWNDLKNTYTLYR